MKLLYGFFSPEATELKKEDAQAWRHAEIYEKQLDILRVFLCLDGSTEDRKANLLRFPNQMTLDIAAKALAFTNDVRSAKTLLKNGAAMSAVIFGASLSCNFEEVNEILESCREEISESHFAVLLNAAAAGAALARASDAVMRYRRMGANAFYIAWAYGMVNDLAAINVLCLEMRPYRKDIIKAALVGFGIGGHFESADNTTFSFTQHMDALTLGISMRNRPSEELHKRFLLNETVSPQHAFLGYVLAGHLEKADRVLEAQKAVNPQFDNDRFCAVILYSALFSQRSGYAEDFFTRYKDRGISLLKLNKVDKSDFLRLLVCVGEVKHGVQNRSAKKIAHSALFQEPKEAEGTAALPAISKIKKTPFSML